MKHWREEWTYKNPVVWKYEGDRTWVKESLSPKEVKGKWTQTVWEVSDEPRHQGFSQFVSLDPRMIWQNTADALLPRREYSVRSDYNLRARTDRLSLADSGFVREQDNRKLIRPRNSDRLLVEGKGLNIYRRIADDQCALAREYWQKNRELWAKVRAVCDRYLQTHDRIHLKTRVEGKMLYEYLMEQAKQFSEGKLPEASVERNVSESINKFIGVPTSSEN